MNDKYEVCLAALKEYEEINEMLNLVDSLPIRN